MRAPVSTAALLAELVARRDRAHGAAAEAYARSHAALLEASYTEANGVTAMRRAIRRGRVRRALRAEPGA